MAATTVLGAGARPRRRKRLRIRPSSISTTQLRKICFPSNGAKAITDLDAWKQHNPDSAFKDDREVMYLQAYQMAKQWDKVLPKAKELMSQNLDAMFSDPAQGPRQVSVCVVRRGYRGVDAPHPYARPNGDRRGSSA